MKFPKIVWNNDQLFKKTPLLLVLTIVLFVGFNVYLNLNIRNTSQELAKLEKLATQPARNVDPTFAKRHELGEKNCPSVKAGRPDAPLKFKLFTTETCPFCVAENKVLNELLAEYGNLFYGEWYDLSVCKTEAEKYKISGVPTFIFNAKGAEKDPTYGFLDKQQMTDYICRVSGEC